LPFHGFGNDEVVRNLSAVVGKITYDQVADILTIIFTDTLVAESDGDKRGVILDYDDKGNLALLKIMNASRW